MKKVLALVFVAVLCLTSVIAVSAAGSINEYEQSILDQLGETITVGDAEFAIPASYINQAKNYFMTVDITAEEASRIVDIVAEGMDVISQQTAQGSSFELSDASAEAKSEILQLAKDACAVVDLELVYDAADEVVTITPAGETTPVFEDTPAIKNTGLNVDVNVLVAVSAVLVLLAAGAVVVSKKVRNF